MLIVGCFQAFLTVGRSKSFAREGLVIGDEDGFVKLRFVWDPLILAKLKTFC